MAWDPLNWTRFRERSHELELLDTLDEASPLVADNFRELAWTNRRFGGTSSVRRFLHPLLDKPKARVLDVGTGTGETCRELQQWSRRRGLDWTMVGLDLSPAVLSLAGPGSGIPLRCAGHAAFLPFETNGFDAVICLQTLHHLGNDAAAMALGEMVRVSNGTVVVSDLRRGAFPYAAAKTLAWTFWRNPLTRHDGPLSVRRAFTPPELERLGQGAHPGRYTVHRHGPFRLVLRMTDCG